MTRRARTGNPLLAIAYIRVSTSRQEIGPEAQRAAIEAWAKREGVSVVAWHVDAGVSGAAPLAERPALLAALADLRALGAGVLVAGKRDRVARDVVLAVSVERAAAAAGAVLRTADGSSDLAGPEGRMMRGIVDVFAEYERGIIRARTKAALGAKKAKGESVGTPAYGFRRVDDGHGLGDLRRAGAPPVRLEEDPDEQRVIWLVRQLRDEGVTQRAIVEELQSLGLLSRAGTTFTQTAIARICRKAA